MEVVKLQCTDFELKTEENGRHTLSAVVAQIDEMDSQRDILAPKSVGKQTVVLSDWSHSSVSGSPPVGKGYVQERANRVLLEAEFFKTARAEEAFQVVKELSETVEYSIGLLPTEYVEGQDSDGRYYRRILKAEVIEVSPVLRGAMPHTRTLNVKEQQVPESDAAEVARWFTKHNFTLRGLQYEDERST